MESPKATILTVLWSGVNSRPNADAVPEANAIATKTQRLKCFTAATLYDVRGSLGKRDDQPLQPLTDEIRGFGRGRIQNTSFGHPGVPLQGTLQRVSFHAFINALAAGKLASAS